MSLREIASLIERTARWVSPETFKLLPLWFPEHGRRGLFYKGNWSEPQMNKNRATGHSVHKSEGNVHANKALTLALGLRSKHRPNWSCCHIWGIDDARYQLSNAIVMDRRFFSCVGNMCCFQRRLRLSPIQCPTSRRCSEFARAICTAGHPSMTNFSLRTPHSTSGQIGIPTPRVGPGRHIRNYPLELCLYRRQSGSAQRSVWTPSARTFNMPALITPERK
jgi:hypothetical protein